MDKRINRVAALANISAYNPEATKKYIQGAPHIKHASLRTLYAELAVQVYDYAKNYTAIPHVLDLGAGEGSVTLPFLELGARVTAVDISSSQLQALQSRCERYGERLEVRCEDVADTLKDLPAHYDIIVANSFLHHIPDYVGMIKEAIPLLTPWVSSSPSKTPCAMIRSERRRGCSARWLISRGGYSRGMYGPAPHAGFDAGAASTSKIPCTIMRNTTSPEMGSTKTPFAGFSRSAALSAVSYATSAPRAHCFNRSEAHWA